MVLAALAMLPALFDTQRVAGTAVRTSGDQEPVLDITQRWKYVKAVLIEEQETENGRAKDSVGCGLRL